jgi:hypothetical protein
MTEAEWLASTDRVSMCHLARDAAARWVGWPPFTM